MNELRRYLPMVACLVACGSDPAPAPVEGDAGTPEPSVDASLPPKPKDAGPDARVLGPAVPVSPDKLGCDGNMRIDGPAIDATGLIAAGSHPERAFVSFTDGTFAATAMEYEVVVKRFDERLNVLAKYPIGPLDLPRPGLSGSLELFRNGSSVGVAYPGRTSENPSRAVALLFGYDFETQKTNQERYLTTVEGKGVSFYTVTAGEAETYLWATLIEDTKTFAWRRTMRAGALWQRTVLEAAPVSQWQEGGKDHFLSTYSGERESVVAADGTVESDVLVPKIPNTTEPCAFSNVRRAGSSLVTVRDIVRLPCADPARNTAPYELWVHLPGDAVGRKLGDFKRNNPSSALGELQLGPKMDALVTVNPTDGSKFTMRLQRLDARMQDLGTPLEVTQPGKHFNAPLVPIAGGYFWFVENVPVGTNKILTSAYHVVCVP